MRLGGLLLLCNAASAIPPVYSAVVWSHPEGRGRRANSSTPTRTFSNTATTTTTSQSSSSAASSSQPSLQVTSSTSRANPASSSSSGRELSSSGRPAPPPWCSIIRCPDPRPSASSSAGLDSASCTTPTSCQAGQATCTGFTAKASPHASACTKLGPNQVSISFVVVHTSTVTLSYGTTSYDMPYPTLTVPRFCPPVHTPFFTYVNGSQKAGAYLTSGRATAITLITTDKNPAVVYPTQPPPHYSFTDSVWQPYDDGDEHSTIDGINISDRQGRGSSPFQINTDIIASYSSSSSSSSQTHPVEASSTQVVIDGTTFSRLGPSETRIVSADSSLFTIIPTAVIGGGQTVLKPDAKTTQMTALQLTSTRIDGLPVVISGASATIDSTSFEIPRQGTTVQAGGRSISIGPDSVIVGKSTLSFEAAPVRPTNHIVVGGDVLTAIGQHVFVIHSTTFTYGVGTPTTEATMEGAVLTIGPSGATLDGTTWGGSLADPTGHSFQVIGGLTLTEQGASKLVVNGSTFTVGPRAARLTTMVGGETLTLGPEGVEVNSLTFTYPFGPVVTTSLVITTTGGQSSPKETDADDDDDDDDSGGRSLRPYLGLVLSMACVVAGILGLL